MEGLQCWGGHGFLTGTEPQPKQPNRRIPKQLPFRRHVKMPKRIAALHHQTSLARRSARRVVNSAALGRPAADPAGAVKRRFNRERPRPPRPPRAARASARRREEKALDSLEALETLRAQREAQSLCHLAGGRGRTAHSVGIAFGAFVISGSCV